MDPPGHINWWQGVLGIDNEKAQSENALDRFLWRYENTKDECDPQNQPVPYIAVVFNFSIFALLLFRFARKPLADALVKRRETIMEDIESSAKLRSQSVKRLDQYEDQLEHLEDKREELTRDYAAQSKREKERLLLEAEERRVRMRRDAEARVEQELTDARQNLLEEAVEGAVAAAQDLLRKQVTSADLDRSAEQYLSELGDALAQEVSGHGRKGASSGAGA